MATSLVGSLPSNITTTPNNLLNFVPCQHTFVATKPRQDHVHESSNSDTSHQKVVPRVCRLRTRDNTMAIYALIDPIDATMLAADVSVNMLVEQLGDISFEDDSYKEKINTKMQNVIYSVENRLLQMTFDHAEEKVATIPSSVSAAEKLLPSLDEAEAGAFLFAATVTQSNVYITYVGNIRTFLISKKSDGDLTVLNDRPQYYHTGSLHVLDNEDESRRLQNLDVDLNQVRAEGLDKKNSKFTRCIGKLTDKLLSSAGLANDVNEARCNPLTCEPVTYKFKLQSSDYALVMMTDNVYQAYLRLGISEVQIPLQIVQVLKKSETILNPAQHILEKLELDLQEKLTDSTEEIDLQDMGILIHFFQHPKGASQTSSVTKSNKRAVVGEVTVDEVKTFIKKHKEIQQKREQNRNSSAVFGHKRETQTHSNTIEPFVRFDVYEKLLNDNQELRQANDFITNLLDTQSTSLLDEKLTEFLKDHSSLICD